jgi:hypothetical protein
MPKVTVLSPHYYLGTENIYKAAGVSMFVCDAIIESGNSET